MQLLVLVLSKVECLGKILSEMLNAGLGEATVFDSYGMLQTLNENNIEPPPIFSSLRHYMNRSQSGNKIVLLVIQEEKVKLACDIINKVTGGLSNPNTGIVFTLPVSYSEGIDKPRN